MAILAQQLTRACNAFGLQIDLNYVAILGNNKEIYSVARINHLGAENGMLIVSSFDEVKDFIDEIEEAGYGFSVIREPKRDEPGDMEACLDMFRDWGWSGPAEKLPYWFCNTESGPSEVDPDTE